MNQKLKLLIYFFNIGFGFDKQYKSFLNAKMKMTCTYTFSYCYLRSLQLIKKGPEAFRDSHILSSISNLKVEVPR
jgi:hypothetical protein